MIFKKRLLPAYVRERGSLALNWMKGDPYVHFHRNHPLAGQNGIPLGSLESYPFVCLQMDEYAKLSMEKQKQAYPDFYVPSRITVNHYHTYLNMVKNSDAFMAGNKWQISELEKMGIQSVRLSFVTHKLHLMMIKKEYVPFSWEAKKFLHLFADSYGLDRA